MTMNRGMNGNKSRWQTSSRGGLDGGRSNQTSLQTEQMMEEMNDQNLEHLGDTVSRLKETVVEIRDTVEQQNTYLDQLAKGMSGATNAVKGSMGKLEEVFKTGGSKHICILIAFAFFVFVGLYYLIKK
eukprot:TRINITY_DN588_c15_g1_i1.p1 TRINITY_DN588_c15_g1~~TRINITY_DN588_c15_g1_i1.p1  ORF type:complete len:128 (+),score=20.87 TRINITY_DN588_c15_g1_i1:41-424(+)